ncbi:MAG: LysR substrate-binding domain-containing protein [Thiolinea sp.]
MTEQSDQLRAQFLSGMSHAAATVNVVTTDGPGGKFGVTVSAMSSVSADTAKPTMLVCVHQASPAAAAILANGVFYVNVLRDDQSYISDSFAGRFKDQLEDKFDCAEWEVMPGGALRVIDPLVGFDCKVHSSELVGTHYVFIGEVQSVFEAAHGSPLIYARRSYGSTMRIEGAVSIDEGKNQTEQTLNMGCFKTFAPFVVPELIANMTRQGTKLKFNLIEGDQRYLQESLLAGQIEAALMYDLDLSDQLDVTPLHQLQPYVLLPKGHELAQHDTLQPADLVSHPMVLLDMPPSKAYFLGIFEQLGLTPDVAFTSGSLEMVRGLVGQGLGYSLLATKPAADLSYDGHELVTRPLLTDIAPSTIVMVTRRGVPLSKAADELVQRCQTFFTSDA